MKVTLKLKSGNEKTGPIPVSTTEENSCPDRCSLKYKRDENGEVIISKQTGKPTRGPCYAKSGPLAIHWGNVSKSIGNHWRLFCAAISRLPVGQFWRHNQAGDMPQTKKGKIDKVKTRQLIKANQGKKGFSYTHHCPELNREIIEECNREGFTINVSCDNLSQADTVSESGIKAPIVAILPVDSPTSKVKTPNGLPVVVCPAQTQDGISCNDCRLCQKANRKTVVGFIAHGRSKNLIGG